MYANRSMYATSFGRFFLAKPFYDALRQVTWKIRVFYHNICVFLGIKRIASTIVLPVDPVLQYVQKRTCKFLETFQCANTAEKYNTNIDTIIYNKTDFFETLVDPQNYLEKIWKKRILIENTPRGNIFMYFDIFKQGFAYYSDQAGVPYKILNAVAMKYVIVFFCRDFFLDDGVLPEGAPSPLLNVFVEDNEEEKQKKREKMDALKMNLENAPFAKFKTYQHTQKPSDNKPIKVGDWTKDWTKDWVNLPGPFFSIYTHIYKWLQAYVPFLRISHPPIIIPDIENKLPIQSPCKKEKVVNKFVNLGHTKNFHPLSVVTKSNVGNSSTHYDSMFSQVQKISYKDFISREKDIPGL